MPLAFLLLGTFLLSPLGADGVIDTVAGTGTLGNSGDGGPAKEAQLNMPFDVAYDDAGNLFFSDTFNHTIRRVDATTGVITTVAGSGKKGFSGDGGPATSATFDEPYGVAIAKDGTFYVADRLNRRVRRIDGKTGVITTVAGSDHKTFSGDGGPGDKAGLVEPNGVALDPSETSLYIADVADSRIRVIDLKTGTISTFAGNGKVQHKGDGGPASTCSIHGARAVEVGRDGTVYILERQGNTLRKVDPKTGTIATIAGTGGKGHADGPALTATFNGPKEMALDAKGNVWIVDTENQTIRHYDAASQTVTTVAGSRKRGGAGDNGPALKAQLGRPHGVALAPDGSFVIGDTENHRIRRVRPDR